MEREGPSRESDSCHRKRVSEVSVSEKDGFPEVWTSKVSIYVTGGVGEEIQRTGLRRNKKFRL